jgi:hypothetical protein
VKRLRADDSMHSYAKVGHCQAPYSSGLPPDKQKALIRGLFAFTILTFKTG